MSTIKVWLKSGAVVEFEAESFQLSHSPIDGGLTGVKWTSGESRRRLVHINIEQVAAVVVVDPEGESSTRPENSKGT
jgi:hypothetical protein